MAAHVSRPPLPGLGDEIDRRVVQGCRTKCTWFRAVDHDLLPLERRVEVRDDADVPAGRAVSEPKRLRRGLVSLPAQNGQEAGSFR